MALNFNLNKIENYETLCLNEERCVKPVTNNLIWATIAVDMGAITSENWEEFHNRIEFGNRLCDWGFTSLTPEVVKAHIGLTTNVSTKTWGQFTKKVVDSWCRDRRFKPKARKRAKAV